MEELGFIQAICDRPSDRLQRLVYADWLDERDDPRGEYLRLLCAVDGWGEPVPDREAALDRLQVLKCDFDEGWLASMQKGLCWRTVFEANLKPFETRDDGTKYEFNPPATEERLQWAERELGFRFPADLRDMLSEFDGIRSSTRTERGCSLLPDTDFLDVENMISVRNRLKEVGWYDLYSQNGSMPIIFICQWDNFAENWGLFVGDFHTFQIGSVVCLDYETYEPQTSYSSLFDFVARGLKR